MPITKVQGSRSYCTSTFLASAGTMSANIPLDEAVYKLKPIECGIILHAAQSLLARLHKIQKYTIIHGDGGTESAIQSTVSIEFLPALFPHLLEGSARICLRFSGLSHKGTRVFLFFLFLTHQPSPHCDFRGSKRWKKQGRHKDFTGDVSAGQLSRSSTGQSLFSPKSL